MKNTGLPLMLLALITMTVSCDKDTNSTDNEQLTDCSSDLVQGDYFFTVEKDSAEWAAIHCNAEYDMVKNRFYLWADRFMEFESGNQVVLAFTNGSTSNFTIDSNIYAAYNFVLGGDAGYFPYEFDSTSTESSIVITSHDAENQMIEGHFNLRLKRISHYENSGFKEYVYLDNGSFKVHYCKLMMLD
jgi:hypothetical protein